MEAEPRFIQISEDQYVDISYMKTVTVEPVTRKLIVEIASGQAIYVSEEWKEKVIRDVQSLTVGTTFPRLPGRPEIREGER